MECNEIYVCKTCGGFFSNDEEFDLHDDHKAHGDAVRMKPLFAAPLEGSDKGLALFKLAQKP